MAKSKNQKKGMLKLYKDLLSNSTGVIVTKPAKLTPNEVNEFRKELFDIGSHFHVVKNTLLKIALKETDNPEIPELVGGEHAVLFAGNDIASSAKLLKKFIEKTFDKASKSDRIEIVKGIVEGSLVEKDSVAELADMPTIQGSVSMILGILDNALSSIVNVLEDAPRAYVSVIDQAFKE